MRIAIDFRPAEGAAIRIIGLVERRGFRVTRIAMDAGEEAMTLTLEPRDPGRGLDVLARQIDRLHDVRATHIHEGIPA